MKPPQRAQNACPASTIRFTHSRACWCSSHSRSEWCDLWPYAKKSAFVAGCGDIGERNFLTGRVRPIVQKKRILSPRSTRACDALIHVLTARRKPDPRFTNKVIRNGVVEDGVGSAGREPAVATLCRLQGQ